MKKLISIFVTLAMIVSMLPTLAIAADEPAFTDVTGSEYYADAAQALAKLNILQGYEDGSFGAQRDITRAEMSAIICRMLGKETDANKSQGKTDFDDVSSSHWASGYINYASENGIINGDGNGKFRPEDNVKYEEAIKMVVCAVGLDDDVTVEPEDWSKEYLEIADDNGITDDVKGSKGKASPRGDVAVMVYNGLTMDLAAPKTSKETGSYSGTQKIELSTTTKDAEIYYTTDGSTPTVKSTKYTKAISISKTATLKAITVVDGVLVSDVTEVKYTIKSSGGGGGSSSSKKYTVSFDLNYEGATGAPASQSVKKGTYATKPTIPQRDGYEFQGWFAEKTDYVGFDFSNTPINNNIVLYAKWIDIYDTTDTDGDGLIDTLEAFYYTDINNPDTDGDGLTDYQEIALCNTNPLEVDSDANNINDGNEDLDSDGLDNLSEIKLGTNPLLMDSDDDGLSDYSENTQYNTNPLNADTDNDGVSDGTEIAIGTDPLVAQSSFSLDYESPDTNDSVKASVRINLSGEQVETLSINPVGEELFPSEMPGYLGHAYSFNVDGDFNEATISFKFDADAIDADSQPTIYYFNENEQKLEELPTLISGNTASATTTHFSTYILLDKTEFDKVWDTDIKPPTDTEGGEISLEIAFVIDSSGSMYDNDRQNLRKSLTKEFIAKMSDTDQATIIDFDRTATVYSDFTSDKEQLTNAVNKIDSDGGTIIYNGIRTALNQFYQLSTNDNKLKVMFLLTDGQDDVSGYTYDMYEEISREALQNDIQIYTVGLGSGVDTQLLELIANTSGGKYYFASSSTDLSEGFDSFIEDTIDYVTDTDNDGIPDYYEDKLVTFNGTKLILDKNNPDCDGDGLLDGEEISVSYSYSDGRVYGKMTSNPNSKDSDNDGIKDKEDTAPLTKGLKNGIVGELTIVSCHPNDAGFTGGHAWLVYKSYINDGIDVSGLLDGYIYDTQNRSFKHSKINSYDINRNGYVAIGNAGTEGTSGALSTIVGSCGGILYNREFYGAWVNENFYLDVAAYTKEITNDEFNKVLAYCSENNYYNLYNHNCSSVASEAWENAFGTDDEFKAKKNGVSHGVYSMFDTPSTLKENILKKSDADTDYRSTMLNIIKNWI